MRALRYQGPPPIVKSAATSPRYLSTRASSSVRGAVAPTSRAVTLPAGARLDQAASSTTRRSGRRRFASRFVVDDVPIQTDRVRESALHVLRLLVAARAPRRRFGHESGMTGRGEKRRTRLESWLRGRSSVGRALASQASVVVRAPSSASAPVDRFPLQPRDCETARARHQPANARIRRGAEQEEPAARVCATSQPTSSMIWTSSSRR